MVTPSNGTSTNISSIGGNRAQIIWDGPVGNYTLSVQVVDGNGCVSQSISQQIEIISSGDLLFAASLPNTMVCSGLAGGMAGLVAENSQSWFRVAYTGDANLVSATITIKNPDGNFMGLDGVVLPDQQNSQVKIDNVETDKEIDFAVSDSWENNSAELIQFEITLISGLTADQTEIPAVSGTDVERTISVLAKVVIEFK